MSVPTESRGVTMSAEYERAESLAEDAYQYEPPELKTAYVEGYLASKSLTEAEWVEERDDVAFVIRLKGDTRNIDQRLIDESLRQAEAAMISLGFTRTSEPGGDTC